MSRRRAWRWEYLQMLSLISAGSWRKFSKTCSSWARWDEVGLKKSSSCKPLRIVSCWACLVSLIWNYTYSHSHYLSHRVSYARGQQGREPSQVAGGLLRFRHVFRVISNEVSQRTWNVTYRMRILSRYPDNHFSFARLDGFEANNWRSFLDSLSRIEDMIPSNLSRPLPSLIEIALSWSCGCFPSWSSLDDG